MTLARELAYERALTPDEVDGVLRGVRPVAMKDKRFAFADNGRVHVHRSWTGREIYSFRRDGASVRDVHVSDDLDDAQAREILDLLFDRVFSRG